MADQWRKRRISRRLVTIILVEPRLFWLALGSLFAGAIAAATLRDEPTLRLVGGTLQLEGLLLVVLQIRLTAREFGLPSVWQRASRQVEKIRGTFLPPITGTMNSTLAPITLESRVELGPLPGPRTESERLAELEIAIEKLKAEVRSGQDRTTALFASLTNRLEQQVAAQSVTNSQLDRKIRTQAVGSLDLAMVGVLLSAVGAFLLAASPEIVRFLSYA